MVLANGSLLRKLLAKVLFERILLMMIWLKALLRCRGQLFYSTQIPVSLWIINKSKNQSGKTLFVDAREMGTMVTRKLREFTDEDIAKVAGALMLFVRVLLSQKKVFQLKQQ